MRVLVIGGAGFLGSHLVDRLLAEGNVVDVVDDLSTGSLANLADARARGGEVKFHHLDAAGPDLVELIGLRRPEVVVHLGSFTGAGTELEQAAAAMTSVLIVAESCRRGGVEKLVTAVPGAELYGPLAAKDIPVKEARGFEPVDVLGVAARTVIDVLQVFRERDALEFTVLVLGDVYGPRQRSDSGPVAHLIAHLEGREAHPPADPGRTFDLVFIDDVVDAVVRSLTRGGGLVVNVGTGVHTLTADLVRAARGVDDTGGITRSFGAPTRFALSPMRARIHLSWAPWTTVGEGLAGLQRR
jgi:UDP-glucose 4-epimerase